MQRKHLIIFILFAILYALFVFSTPVDQAVLTKYHLSLSQVRILDVLIIIPLCIIWFLAFYGFSAFDLYARLIRRDKDGDAFHNIARGIMILAIGSAATTIFNAAAGLYTHSHLESMRYQVIAGNYLTMLVTVASFYFIYKGAVRLCKITKKQRVASSGPLVFNLGYIAFAAVYTYVFVVHLPAAKNVPLTATSHAAYYTPNWVLIPTFLVSYLLAWYLGGLSVYLLYFYTRHIGGRLYSSVLRYLSTGVAVVVAGSVIFQILTVFTGQLQNLSTASLLILIYLLLAIIAAGYVPIAIGAKKLAKIETV